MAGALLRSGDMREFHALGAVGKPVFSAASQLRAAVRRQLGADTADLFAIPKQNEAGDAIDWYAPNDGNVVPWSAATDEERNAAKTALITARERLFERSQALQAEEDSERQIFGKLLAQATQIPSEDHIYLVNGQPVMTFWGFHPRNAPAGLDVIGGLDAHDVPTAPERLARDEPVVVPPPLPPEERRRRPWWWWLLALLLLLLLLLGLFYLLRGCEEDQLSEPQLPTLPTVEEDNAVIDRDLGVLRERDGVFITKDGRRLTIDRDRGVWIDQRTGEVVGPVDPNLEELTGDAIPGTEDGAEAPMDEDAAPQDAGTPETSPGTEPETAPEDQAPGEQPMPPDGQQPPQDQQSPGEQQPGEPSPDMEKPGSEQPAPSETAAQQTLTIPDQAVKDGSTEFLRGQWRSTTSLRDTQGKPIGLSYDFQNGKGTVNLQRSVGGRTVTCAGQASSSMQNGKLVIDQRGIRCPDGTTFQNSQVECAVGAGGKADCQGKNEDGSAYDVNIAK